MINDDLHCPECGSKRLWRTLKGDTAGNFYLCLSCNWEGHPNVITLDIKDVYTSKGTYKVTKRRL